MITLVSYNFGLSLVPSQLFMQIGETSKTQKTKHLRKIWMLIIFHYILLNVHEFLKMKQRLHIYPLVLSRTLFRSNDAN